MLDAGPLGLVTNPQATPQNEAAGQWLAQLPLNGYAVALPEIADYDVRRELIRASKARGLRRLDELKSAVLYVPLTTGAMLLAAQFWAQARQRGRPTASDAALDADVILAAQAVLLASDTDQVLIATTNVDHLSPFADARLWQEIA